MIEQFLSEEEERAIATLAKRHRLMIQIIPQGASDEFCARLSTFVNLILDLKLLPPIPVLAKRLGDGLVCPYCGVGIRADFKRTIERHAKTCEWRVALERWAYANMQIDDVVDSKSNSSG